MAARTEPAPRRLDQGAPLLRRGSLGELAARLERLRTTRKDVVADTRDVRLVLRNPPAPEGETPVYLDVPKLDTMPLTRYAETQLAEKVGIPQRYYDRMKQDAPGLLIENVNKWLTQEPAPRLIRSAEGHVRAFLSDKYRVIDSEDVAILVAQQAEQHEAQVVECALSETRMTVKVALPQYREKIGEMTAELRARHTGVHQVGHGSVMDLDADYMIPGLAVTNSEVGAGAFKVEPLAYRLVCWNAAVGEASLTQVHLGGRLAEGEVVYREETKRLTDEALAAQVRDVVDSAFNRDTFRVLVERFKGAKSVAVLKPVEVIDTTVRVLGIPQEQKEQLLRQFMLEGPTLFGLVNGITAFAQDQADPDEQMNLERAAGNILSHPGLVGVEA